jgi:hypothetical protein
MARRSKKDPEREDRINTGIVVDAYGPEEQAMAWYNYLGERLHFPYLARCIAERAISPLRKGDEVEVVGLGPESECRHELFVEMPWERRTLAVPLSQLKPVHADDETWEAVEDWLYWVAQGHEL